MAVKIRSVVRGMLNSLYCRLGEIMLAVRLFPLGIEETAMAC